MTKALLVVLIGASCFSFECWRYRTLIEQNNKVRTVYASVPIKAFDAIIKQDSYIQCYISSTGESGIVTNFTSFRGVGGFNGSK